MLLSWLYCWGSSRIINPTHGPLFSFFFFSSTACFNRLRNQCETNVWQHANDILRLWNKLPFSLLPPRQTRSQFTFRRVRLFYINRQPLWQGVWLGGGPQIPLKVHSSLAECLKTGRVTRREGSDWKSVVVVLSVPNSVYVPTVKHRYHPAVISASDEGGNQLCFWVPEHVQQDRDLFLRLEASKWPPRHDWVTVCYLHDKKIPCCFCCVSPSVVSTLTKWKQYEKKDKKKKTCVNRHSQPNSSLVLAASCLSISAAMLSDNCWICEEER